MTAQARRFLILLLVAIIATVLAGSMLVSGSIPSVVHNGAMQRGIDFGLAVGVAVGSAIGAMAVVS